MKNKYYLYILPLCAIFLFNGKKYDESVIERIHLNVNICIEGEECGEVATIADAGAAPKGTKLSLLDNLKRLNLTIPKKPFLFG